MNKFLIIWLYLLRLAAGEREIKILPPLKAITNGRAGMRPHHKRTNEVMRALDEAPDGKTYEQLIAYVRERSRIGCSRRIVAKWKRTQKMNG